MKKSVLLSLVGSLALVLAVGCNNPSEVLDTGGGVDVGAGEDTGGELDGGARDAGSDAPSDAGVPTDTRVGDAVVTFAAACPTFSSCGGDVVGTWNYTSICIENDEIVGPFQETCPGTVLLSGSGSASGVITITDTEISRMVQTSVNVTVVLGESCTGLCRAAAGIIESRVAGSSASCAVDGGDSLCHCDVAFGSTVDTTDTYTLGKGILLTDGGRSFSYCVEPDGSLRYREEGTSPEPGVSTSVGGG